MFEGVIVRKASFACPVINAGAVTGPDYILLLKGRIFKENFLKIFFFKVTTPKSITHQTCYEKAKS